MEDLQSAESPYVVLREAFTANDKASVADLSRNHRVLLCHQVASLVRFLHSREFVVKVISDKSIYVRKEGDCLVPTLANLEEVRSVIQ
jgi:hypothetical protein